ncbi:Storkhead-Box Protein 2 [Manis pentadactyla]|nr:Storkhead-Box Protein 2 [Manis pentadactyla]
MRVQSRVSCVVNNLFLTSFSGIETNVSAAVESTNLDCTRESLASNTSSIVESNRRQNPTLSPVHGGAGPAFNFRASTDPPANDAEKLQKPSNCLQASVTSV